MYTTVQMFGVSKYLMPTKAAFIWLKIYSKKYYNVKQMSSILIYFKL